MLRLPFANLCGGFVFEEGKMAIIFTFHKDRASIIKVYKKKNRIVSESIKEIRKFAQIGEYLGVEKNLDEIISTLIDEETIHEKCYVNLTFGTGIQYNTFKIATSALEVGNGKRSYEDAYDDLMAICLEHLPDGVLKLHEKYCASILSCYESDGDVTISCAFIPDDYMRNIKKVFANKGLPLFGIGSQASGTNNMVNFENKQLVLEIESEYQVFNEFGILIWPKPEKELFSREEILEFISEESAELYPVTPKVMNLYVENVTNHLNFSVECSADDLVDEIAAMGKIIESRSELKPMEGGVKNSAKDFIRKLFEKV